MTRRPRRHTWEPIPPSRRIGAERSARPRQGAGRFRRLVGAAAAIALVGALMGATGEFGLGAVESAVAAPGNPGVPSPGTPFFRETFSQQNATSAIDIRNYVGASGMTYSADPAWLPDAGSCNGWILNATTPVANPGSAADRDCRRGDAWTDLQTMTTEMGLAQGMSAADAQRNQAMTAFSNNHLGLQDPGYVLRTNKSLTGVAGHYYVVSAQLAAINCGAAVQPSFTFSLIVTGQANAVTSGLNPCASGPARLAISTLNSTAYKLGSPASLGFTLYNATASGNGNDVAVDIPSILDVTPQLDKSFSPTTVNVGGVSRLTFTVTNTSELAAKNGWSFTDNLPSGLVVASTPGVQTTCSGGSATAVAGSSTVSVSGNLNAGQASCTVSVNVTAPAGTYQNCAANFPVLNGVLAPACATVQFVNAAAFTIRKQAFSGSTELAQGATVQPGTTITYRVTATNTGSVAIANTVLQDNLSDVLDNATFVSGSAQLSVGFLTTPVANPSGSTLTTAGFTLPAGGSAVLEYKVTVNANAWSATLRNTVVGQGGTPANPVNPTCPVSCTTTQVTPAATASWTVGKQAYAGATLLEQGATVQPGTVITYRVTATNTGPVTVANAAMRDNLADVLDNATFVPGSAHLMLGSLAIPVDEPNGSNTTLASWTFSLPASTTVVLEYKVTVNADAWSATLRNVVTGSSSTIPPSCPVSCTTTQVTPASAPSWELGKEALIGTTVLSQGAVVQPGDSITYRVTAKNTGAVAITNATLTDDLSQVLDDATFVAGSVRLTIGSGAPATIPDPAGPTLSTTFALPAGTTAVLTYQAKVKDDAWSAILRNAVVGSAGTPENPVTPTCPVSCTTTQNTPTPFQILKVGEDSTGAVVPMDGSQWAIFTAASGGTPVVGAVIPATDANGTVTGLFRDATLAPGTYWLEETRALDGFALLATRVQFTIAAGGTLTLGAQSASTVTVIDQDGIPTIRVEDVPAFALPDAGGSGVTVIYLAGGALLAAAILAAGLNVVRRRRNPRGRGETSQPATQPNNEAP